jgi:DNA-binding transcriptional LysR family regulator
VVHFYQMPSHSDSPSPDPPMPTAAEADILAVLWRLVPATLLVTLQSEFAERAPGTRLAFHSAYSTTQIELLLKGTIQAGIIELPAKGEGLETHCLWHDELVVAFCENHPLATRSEIDRHDLSNEPVIGVAKSLNLALHEYFVESCQRLGPYDCPMIRHERHEGNRAHE